MEILVKTIFFLCLCSSAICSQLSSLLSNKIPLGFDWEFNPFNQNLFNVNPKINEQVKPKSHNQCFCLPSNSKNELVSDILGPKNHKLEKLSLFLYRKDGLLKAFIPNKQKQQLIPDLSFDVNDGDVLKPIFTETLAEVFENNPSVVTQQPQEIQLEIDESEGDTMEVGSSVDNHPILFDTNPPKDTENEMIESIAEEMPSTEVNTLLHPMPNEINYENYNNINPVDEQNDVIVDIPKPSEQNSLLNNQELENINESDALDQTLLYLPSKSQKVTEPPLPLIRNPHADVLEGGKNLKFNDWFRDQLSHIALHNLVTRSNVEQLKLGIEDVLEHNGMFLSNNGFLFDPDGNMLKMSSIKLRPILIGDPVESHKFNPQTGYHYMLPKEISYLQLILIISTDPPEILGVVPMGKVYLPRKINRQNQGYLTKENNVKSPKRRCKTCKYPDSQKTQQFNSLVEELPYIELPLRRNFDNGNNMLLSSLSRVPSSVFQEAQGQIGRDDNSDDLSSMVQRLMRIFGTANIFGGQTRRLLGGKLSKMDRPGPQRYPNDDLPGLRIIGGNPATSSGTPLVSKGRSGYPRRFST